jgi:RND superfamily putative drug exporter
LAQADIPARVHIAGTTAELADLRTVTQGDFYRVAALALGAILVIVVALLRDVWLSVFMVAATVLSYLSTLGLTFWVFSMLGAIGLDWKVQVFLFIVMVAVGQDYNLFFAMRLAQEARRHPPLEAARLAIIHTGPVISSCGVIMAATLGSVMAGDVTLLVQLGFALALGMLIDTFVVRPLLLPAFIVLTRRTLKKASGITW